MKFSIQTVSALISFALPSLCTAYPDMSSADMSPHILSERQQPCCLGDCVYKLVGDGDPHTDYLHKQVSETTGCGAEGTGGSDDGCSVSYLTSYTIGWSASVTGTINWLSGGFSVQESVTTGDTYTCSAGPGESVCVWVDIPHIAYTVALGVVDPNYQCTTQPYGPLVMESPTGTMTYYCVRGDACRTNGEEYWCYTNDGC